MNPSRASANELLAGLRAGRWRPAASARFAARSARRSAQQAARHPRALAEVTVLHGMLAVLAGRAGRRRVAASWVLAATHFGLLGTRRSLGAADVITLLRANLPAVGGPARWLPALALASDLADGRIARRAGTVTAFGTHADSLADAAFWTWYTLRHEPSRPAHSRSGPAACGRPHRRRFRESRAEMPRLLDNPVTVADLAAGNRVAGQRVPG